MKLPRAEQAAVHSAYRALASTVPLQQMLQHRHQALVLRLLARRYQQRGARS